MTLHEEKRKLFDKYSDDIATCYGMYRRRDIPGRIYQNIKKKFHRRIDENGVLGFYDTSLLKNGIEGYIFAENYLCCRNIFEGPRMIVYNNINRIGVKRDPAGNNEKTTINIHLTDGKIFELHDSFVNMTSMEKYITEMTRFKPDGGEGNPDVIVEEKGYSMYSAMLDDLIGLDEVKEQVKKITAFAKLKKDMENKGVETIPMSLNMEFVGNPGTAKTTVARIMAGLLYEIGILSNEDIVEVGRADLVGQYVGHTADRVRSAFKRAKGRVLFIDEAYSLLDDVNGSFGDEAINTIVQEMENCREDTVVIFAGYPDKMENFVARNPGLRSRIPFVLRFRDYSVDEMVRITEAETKKRGFSLSPDAKIKIKEICSKASGNITLGNGRFCRNIVENALLNYSSRVYGNGCEENDADFLLSDEDFSVKSENDMRRMTYGFG